jgi:alkylhydroperoxidase family enzyme
MTRIPLVAREETAERELEAYDEIAARMAARDDDEPSPYLAAMLRTPTMGAAVNELGRQTRLAPAQSETYTYADFELVVHALGVDAGFIQHHHILDALAQGVSADALAGVLRGDQGPLSEDQRSIVDFARRVVHRTMQHESWEAIRVARGERGVVDLTILAGFVWATMCWQRAWGVPGATVEEIEQMLRSHDEGTLALPDKQTAIRAS